MKSILKQLPKSKFVRIHRSYIVAIDHIEEIEESTLTVNGKILPISRSFKKELKERIHII